MMQFPFTAIVGMELAKRSLIYHAIDPRIGGMLLLGHRGCAKSTLVRAFSEILQSANEHRPFVEIPLGATEDRLLGSVNPEALVERGSWQGRAGLIESAHGGVLYVDEINLLPDSLADVVLDSAASGQYRMERDGFTRVVESRYILIGTMNPEEGDLRPQLSDRFAHGVRVRDDFNAAQRMEIVRRRLLFDDDPQSFLAACDADIAGLKTRIARARAQLKDVDLPVRVQLAVAEKGEALRLEGMRTELAVVRTARCAAAWDDRRSVDDRDLEEAWKLCLGHRDSSRPAPASDFSAPPRKGSGAASRSSSGSFSPTPPAPLDAEPDARKIAPLESAPQEELCHWWRKGVRRRPAWGRTPAGHLSDGCEGPIAWLDSLTFSWKAKWLPGRSGLRLLRRIPSAKRALWCFLDASRSTGMNRFLESARNAIGGLARAAGCARLHLLVLEGGRNHWKARNAGGQRFEAALAGVTAATGKSLIAGSLKALHRAMLRRSGSSFDRVLIVSDGLASPDPAAREPAHTRRQLRHALKRIIGAASATAWIHPPPHRGLARWLPSVCRDLDVERIEIEPQAGIMRKRIQ